MVNALKEGVVTSMKVTGIFIQYVVEDNGSYYYGGGRNWMEGTGGSLKEVWDHDYIDRLEQAVKDYDSYRQMDDV